MLGLLVRAVLRSGLVKPYHLVKPVSVTILPERSSHHQDNLPKLPVPPLRQTFERYLLMLEPLLSEEELDHTRKLVKEFLIPGGVGDRLQRSLERRASNKGNWVGTYCKYNKSLEGYRQLKICVDCETLPIEYLGGKPLCMDQYYQILSSCRIPGPKRDTVVNHAVGKVAPTHITVVHNFQFFILDMYNSDGSPLTVDQIYMQLEKVWNSSLQSNKEPIGILTSQHRNTWGKAYNNLIKDKTNKESVRAIQKSIFTVCLDAPMPQMSEQRYQSRVAAQMLHGGGSRWNSGNRWFDKTLQFIVGEDGTCGLVYEHAPAEGPPIVFLVDHVVEYMMEVVRTPMTPLPMPPKLRFNITPEVKKDIESAKQNMNIMSHDLDVNVVFFSDYGRNVPRAHKLSPDAFIQMALQLAYFRMYKMCCSTYESASLRMFALGRTDTIRSCSNESLKFVQAMEHPAKPNAEKVFLLDKACQAHREYTHMAIHGQAIDRHLLGLKLQAIEELTSMPEIFMDTAYAVAEHPNLSTSQAGAKTDCVMCFGPMVPDGYGVCYNPMADHINIAITAFNSCEETHAANFGRGVKKALRDMRSLLEETANAKQ
uniref:Carnitine O-acetyltransferase n=1 Tax=Oncorhynchus kisutch TaxID=8019 RepID=A0A8C7CUE8_ONCKI